MKQSLLVAALVALAVAAAAVVATTPALAETDADASFSGMIAMSRIDKNKDGILTYSAAVVGAFASTGLTDIPDIQFVIAPGSFKEGRIGELEDLPGLSLGVWQMRPESRGSVHMTSKDPGSAPIIDPAYLSHAVDRATVVEGLRIGRRLAEQPSLARYVVNETLLVAFRRDKEFQDWLGAAGERPRA